MRAGLRWWWLPVLGLLLALPLPAAAYAFISTAGCGADTGAAWRLSQGPSAWYLHDAGYDRMERDRVQSILEASMEVWAAPCCSGWRHRYEGLTSVSALAQDHRNVVEFAHDTWPQELGSASSTIAVTLPIATVNCTIVRADILFNAVRFTFRDDGRSTDLQSIATHEFGHWLGLGHTDAPGGTMLPFYSGGTAERTLEPDDVAGVCALYPDHCGDCVRDADCRLGESCQAGSCAPRGCVGNADCPLGTICDDGACTPGCRSDAECAGGRICVDGTCGRDPANCAVCEPCTSDASCGDGYLCLQFGSGGVCTRPCETSLDCDGDSACWPLQDTGGNVHRLCFAPEPTTTSWCPADWVCNPDGPGSCPGLWQRCASDRSCGTGTCADAAGNGGRCTCSCNEDRDCGNDAVCRVDRSGNRVCMPADACDLLSCEEGLVCVAGACVDPCADVVCGDGATCDAGICVGGCNCPAGQVCDDVTRACVPDRRCGTSVCVEGERCDDGVCVAAESCGGVVCGDGERCEDGACVLDAACAGVQCDAGERCVAGVCTPADACDGVVCEAGTRCVDGRCEKAPASKRKSGGCAAAGADPAVLALLGGLGALLRRRR